MVAAFGPRCLKARDAIGCRDGYSSSTAMTRKFAALACFFLLGLVLVTLGAMPPAHAVAPAAHAVAPPAHAVAPGPGYQCLPLSSLTTAKAGKPSTLAVHLDGFVVSYTAEEAHLATGLYSYPGALEVTTATKSWLVPPPADPKDHYFELGGLCAVNFGPGATPSPPDVLAEGYWGGAHCCYGPTLYQYSAGGYRVVEDLTKPGVGNGLHWNANGGFEPEKVGAAVVLESSDGAFPYTFGCYACTPAPLRLFTAADGRLIDVTTKYPALISAEAAAAWTSAVQSMRSAAYADVVEGPLAEWAADRCELGEGAQMWRMLEALQAQRKLAAAEQQAFNNKEPFPAQLKAFLLKEGYCQGQLS